MTDNKTEFERAASSHDRSLPAEFIAFLKNNKKFYLIPIIIVLFAMAVLVVLGGTAAAPFIYTLF